MPSEQISWLLKVLQPERNLLSLPGGTKFTSEAHAALLDLPLDIYIAELGRLQAQASQAARSLLANREIVAMIDRLPIQKGARIVAYGDSLTSDPQAWAVILRELLAISRSAENVSLCISAVAGETTTHGLVRFGEVVKAKPDWIIFLLGTNDARTQGPNPTKTLVHHTETARNVAELRQRAASETTARCIWITPPAVNEAQVEAHWGLANFGVRFSNDDLARVADIVRSGDAPVIDAFTALGNPPQAELLMDDGLHLTVAGHMRVVAELIRGWSELK